jgi:hypothetical protein
MKNLFQQADWDVAAKQAWLAGFPPAARVLSTHSRRSVPFCFREQNAHR